jgi:uncharacterized membrane protein (UPF0136 family)
VAHGPRRRAARKHKRQRFGGVCRTCQKKLDSGLVSLGFALVAADRTFVYLFAFASIVMVLTFVVVWARNFKQTRQYMPAGLTVVAVLLTFDVTTLLMADGKDPFALSSVTILLVAAMGFGEEITFRLGKARPGIRHRPGPRPDESHVWRCSLHHHALHVQCPDGVARTDGIRPHAGGRVVSRGTCIPAGATLQERLRSGRVPVSFREFPTDWPT